MPIIRSDFVARESTKAKPSEILDLNYFGVTFEENVGITEVKFEQLPESEKKNKRLYISESAVKYATANSTSLVGAARFLNVNYSDFIHWAKIYVHETGKTYYEYLKEVSTHERLNRLPTIFKNTLEQKSRFREVLAATKKVRSRVTEEYKQYQRSIINSRYYQKRKRTLVKPPRDFSKNKNLYVEKSLEDIITNKYPNYEWNRYVLKLFEVGLLKRECCKCGFSGKRIIDGEVPLKLFLKNYDVKDHSLENIELYCYNCYFIYVGNLVGRNAGVIHNKETNQLASIDRIEIPSGKRIKELLPYTPKDTIVYIQDLIVDDVPYTERYKDRYKGRYKKKNKPRGASKRKLSLAETVDPNTLQKYTHDSTIIDGVEIVNSTGLSEKELYLLYESSDLLDQEPIQSENQNYEYEEFASFDHHSKKKHDFSEEIDDIPDQED